MGCCNQLICELCLTTCLAQKSECPQCRANIIFDECYKDITAYRYILSRKCSCLGTKCEWIGELSDLEHHVSKCTKLSESSRKEEMVKLHELKFEGKKEKEEQVRDPLEFSNGRDQDAPIFFGIHVEEPHRPIQRSDFFELSVSRDDDNVQTDVQPESSEDFHDNPFMPTDRQRSCDFNFGGNHGDSDPRGFGFNTNEDRSFQFESLSDTWNGFPPLRRAQVFSFDPSSNVGESWSTEGRDNGRVRQRDQEFLGNGSWGTNQNLNQSDVIDFGTRRFQSNSNSSQNHDQITFSFGMDESRYVHPSDGFSQRRERQQEDFGFFGFGDTQTSQNSTNFNTNSQRNTHPTFENQSRQHGGTTSTRFEGFSFGDITTPR
jgi:hypothetical protein